MSTTGDKIKWIIIGSVIGAAVSPIVSALIKALFNKIGLRLGSPKYPVRRMR